MGWLRKTRDATGQAVIIFSAILLLLALGGVMVVDVGGALATRAEYRRTADLVALAAAADLPDTTQAQISADAALLANDFDDTNPDLASFVSFPAADQIEVRVEGARSLSFGAIFGLPDWNVTATAVAELTPQPLPYAIMAMDPSACGSLLARGQAEINITGGRRNLHPLELHPGRAPHGGTGRHQLRLQRRARRRLLTGRLLDLARPVRGRPVGQRPLRRPRAAPCPREPAMRARTRSAAAPSCCRRAAIARSC